MNKKAKREDVVCVICGLPILKDSLVARDGIYYHSKCLDEHAEKERNDRRSAIKIIGLGTALATATFLGADKIASATTIPTGGGISSPKSFVLPQLYFDPPNAQPGQMWYRLDRGVTVYHDGVAEMNVYSGGNHLVLTVSAEGLANGLSDIPNDGADFGPDTMLTAKSPSQYGPPYTQTSGIQEALNYAQSQLRTCFPPQFSSPVRPIYYNVKRVRLLPGLFNISSPIALPFFGEYNGYLTFLPNELEGSGPLATFIIDATSTGLSSMVTINAPTGGYIPNQEISQENFNYIGNFSLVANNNNTQYGLELNIGDDPPHATVEHINFIGNFKERALWYNSDESFIHYLSFFNTNSAINATIYANGGVAYADHLYASGFNYLNLEIGGSQVYISDSLINTLSIGTQNPNNPMGSPFGIGDAVLNNVWFGNAGGIGYTIGLFNGLRGLFLNNAHLKVFATSTTPSQSPPAFYLGYTPTSSRAFNTLYIRSYDMNAIQAVSGAATMLSGDTSGSEWLRTQFANIDACTEYSGFAISTSEFISINGRWIGKPTTPPVPASGTALQNTNPYAVVVYVYGGTVTEILYTPNNGTSVEVSNTTPATIRLNTGDSITLLYSSTPSWAWMGA